MKAKHFIIVAIAATIIIASVLAISLTPQKLSTDNIGGKYGAVVTHYTDHTQLTYTDEAGSHSSAS